MPALFLGRSLVDTGDGFGTSSAVVQVQEVFHGLAPDQREVEVNTGFGTSCYTPLAKDEVYVIYAHKGVGGILGAGGCTPLFRAAGNALLIEAIRRTEADSSSVYRRRREKAVRARRP